MTVLQEVMSEDGEPQRDNLKNADTQKPFFFYTEIAQHCCNKDPSLHHLSFFTLTKTKAAGKSCSATSQAHTLYMDCTVTTSNALSEAERQRHPIPPSSFLY